MTVRFGVFVADWTQALGQCLVITQSVDFDLSYSTYLLMTWMNMQNICLPYL